jgi:hypothetical protein
VNVSKTSFRLLFTHFLLLITVIYLFDREDIPRSFIVVHYLLLSCLILGFRYIYICLPAIFIV